MMRSGDEVNEHQSGESKKTRLLLRALDAFTRSESWHEAKQVVQTHNELLTEEADALLGALIARQTDHQAIRILQEHRYILARCRKEGIEAAFAERLADANVLPEGVDPVLWMRLQSVSSYEALMALMDAHPELMPAVKQRIGEVLGPAQITVINAVQAFLAANSWEEAYTVVVTHPALLTLDADIWLTQYMQFVQAQGDVPTTEALAERRWLLARCRMMGVGSAFGNLTKRDGAWLDMSREFSAYG